jgi:hypothetical protein
MLYLHPATLVAINFDPVQVDNFKAENPDGLYVTQEWLEAMIERGFDVAHLAKFSLRPDVLRHFEALVDVAWDYQQLARGFIDALKESDFPFWVGQLVHFQYADTPVEPDKQYSIGKIGTVHATELNKDVAWYRVEWSTPMLVGGRIIALAQE